MHEKSLISGYKLSSYSEVRDFIIEHEDITVRRMRYGKETIIIIRVDEEEVKGFLVDTVVAGRVRDYVQYAQTFRDDIRILF